MKVSIHHPQPQTVGTLNTGTHIITMQDPDGGTVDLFIGRDWSEWDAIVAAVAAYRANAAEPAA